MCCSRVLLPVSTSQPASPNWMAAFPSVCPSCLQIPAAKAGLETSLPELFDVLSCYFPVTFTPPPNNVHGITRQGLATALEAALACCPLYADQLVPLALEKLSSNLK